MGRRRCCCTVECPGILNARVYWDIGCDSSSSGSGIDKWRWPFRPDADASQRDDIEDLFDWAGAILNGGVGKHIWVNQQYDACDQSASDYPSEAPTQLAITEIIGYDSGTNQDPGRCNPLPEFWTYDGLAPSYDGCFDEWCRLILPPDFLHRSAVCPAYLYFGVQNTTVTDDYWRPAGSWNTELTVWNTSFTLDMYVHMGWPGGPVNSYTLEPRTARTWAGGTPEIIPEILGTDCGCAPWCLADRIASLICDGLKFIATNDADFVFDNDRGPCSAGSSGSGSGS